MEVKMGLEIGWYVKFNLVFWLDYDVFGFYFIYVYVIWKILKLLIKWRKNVKLSVSGNLMDLNFRVEYDGKCKKLRGLGML